MVTVVVQEEERRLEVVQDNEVYHERNIPSWCAAEAQCTTIQNQPFHKLHDMGGTSKGLDKFLNKNPSWSHTLVCK